MSKSFVINNITYTFPEQGQEPPWGEDVVDWAEAVTDALSGVSSTGDILTTSVSLSDNVSSVTNIVCFSFDSATLQGAIAEYSVYRTDGTTGYVETGHMFFSYNAKATTWYLAQTGVGVGDTGITFSVTTSGQVQYTSTSLGGTHSCKLVFRAHGFSNS